MKTKQQACGVRKKCRSDDRTVYTKDKTFVESLSSLDKR